MKRSTCVSRRVGDTRYQGGSMIIEALIALILFSFGMLGLIGLQAAAINTNADTGYRVEANDFANRMFAEIQASIRRDSQANYLADLQSFDHLSTGGDNNCEFSGTASANARVTAWLNDLQNPAMTTRLPQATAQIRVTTGAVNQVRIVVCWQQPGLSVPRRHVLMGAAT